MYGLLALIVIISVKTINPAVIRLDDIKFNVNGAPTVTDKNNETVTTPKSVNEDVNNTDKADLTENRTNSAIVTDSPIVLSNVPVIVPAKTIPKKKHQEMLLKNRRRQNEEFKHKPHIKVTIIKSETSNATAANTTDLVAKNVSENLIESRRTPGFSVYVPISEDILPRYDEDSVGKGIERSGLSLIDLKGKNLRIRL
ncbi:hypothetical protein HF086_005084 [Spodoptera exigua]|uniref:Uncharacterized protein n=1 Tax=Spodoptera exigua TaxID=7107 RepID=A0A922MH79_SPOEX|nr:hypothetical protein HF086_005084 [Spodoptera exigua]